MIDFIRRSLHIKAVEVGPIAEYLGRWLWFVFLLGCLASPIICIIAALLGIA